MTYMQSYIKNLLIKEHMSFLDEVIRKIVRAQVDRDVFNIRRNDKSKTEAEREQANKLYLSTVDGVKDLYEVLQTLESSIKELKGGAKTK